ncbi:MULTISPECIES: MarR family winged helix-turn-helix transcriptional regulator [Roseomonadaceae]|uniref:Winged helix-turn-helix transcriptional regulator n=1 Tax=Falsiroseomonas oleicola TaxID=2801474 RepID=A0ABS6H496_9PROT|nr:MarR family winged helix-turn-helix transcriptional regulator [Roseomonas oleicola]MBU8543500.1 winged helix-turn-helix transcriptional regulator [Roseomonas oleicola]
MRSDTSTTLARRLSDHHAAIYRHCHAPYTTPLSHQAVRALQYAAEGGATIRSLGQAIGCATNTASEITRRLADKGLITKTRRSSDERVVEVSVTSQGMVVLREHTGLDEARLAACLARLTQAERDRIAEGMALLLRCVTGGEPPC